MFKYRATLNGYHIEQSNSKRYINNRTKTNERTIKHVVKMINNISTQNLYIKTIMYYLWSWYGIFINKVLVPSSELFLEKERDVLWQTSGSSISTQTLVTFYKVWVGAARSWISNKLGNIYPICRWTTRKTANNRKTAIIAIVVDSNSWSALISRKSSWCSNYLDAGISNHLIQKVCCGFKKSCAFW